MSLEEWLANGWLTEHETSKQEIADLLGIVERDLAASQTPNLTPDWRFNIAYNAALQAATAALAAEGYRAARESHHYRVIQSLAYTLGADAGQIRLFDQFRKKRNVGEYGRAGTVSDQEAEEVLALAQALRDDLKEWLHAHHPELM